MKHKNVEKIFSIRVFCTICGKMITESNRFSKNELVEHWDMAVLSAPMTFSCTESEKKPNLNLEFKIHRYDTNLDYNPRVILPKRSLKDDNKLIKKLKNLVK